MNIRVEQTLRTLQGRYRALERRDRIALLALAAFVGLLILYYGVWNPANEFFQSRQAARNSELSLVKYMRASEVQARASRTAGKPSVSGQALLTQISRTAQQFQISPSRLQPEGAAGVSVWFDDVSFNNLIRWLELQSQRGVTIRQITIDRQADEGRVKARIVLRS